MTKARQISGILAGVFFLIICGVLIARIFDTSSDTAPVYADVKEVSAQNWGLSFQTKGQAPIGNLSADTLKQWNGYYCGDINEKTIYLTFDCGYENGYTNSILDTLSKHNAPAAFFVVGHMVESAPDIVRRMAKEGHIVANHTCNHPDMSAISDKDSFLRELNDLEKKYRETTGLDMPKLYRPPRGTYSEANLALANELGYKTILWSLAYVDWYTDKQPTKEQAFDKLLPRIHNGAIVLLHSTSSTNAEILDELLTKWEAEGYRFGTLTELTENKSPNT